MKEIWLKINSGGCCWKKVLQWNHQWTLSYFILLVCSDISCCSDVGKGVFELGTVQYPRLQWAGGKKVFVRLLSRDVPLHSCWRKWVRASPCATFFGWQTIYSKGDRLQVADTCLCVCVRQTCIQTNHVHRVQSRCPSHCFWTGG